MANGEDLLVVQAREEWQTHLLAGIAGMLKYSEMKGFLSGWVITGIEKKNGKTIYIYIYMYNRQREREIIYTVYIYVAFKQAAR